MPAIKPACAGSVTRRVSVLGTEATVAREYTRALIRDYAGDCQVTLVGSKNLAAFAEAELAGAPAEDAAVAAEIAPCFREDSARTDTVVLACTHYPLILERLRRLAPWPVNFIDPAPAIARRVVSLLGRGASRDARRHDPGDFHVWARSIGRACGLRYPFRRARGDRHGVKASLFDTGRVSP